MDLNEIYYNIGKQLGTSNRYVPQYYSLYGGNLPSLNERDELIRSGKSFIDTGKDYGGTPRRVLDVQERQGYLDNALRMRERGDTGNYGKNVKGFNRSIESLKEFVGQYQPEVKAWDSYKKMLGNSSSSSSLVKDRVQSKVRKRMTPEYIGQDLGSSVSPMFRNKKRFN